MTSEDYAFTEKQFSDLPHELLSLDANKQVDRWFIFYIGMRLRHFREIIPKCHHAACNVILSEISDYLALPQYKEYLLTVAESRHARQRRNSLDLQPTNYVRNPKGHGGVLTLDALCKIHSLISLVCTPSSEMQKIQSLHPSSRKPFTPTNPSRKHFPGSSDTPSSISPSDSATKTTVCNPAVPTN